VCDQLELRRQRRLLDAEKATLDRFVRFFDLSLDLLCTADETLHFRDLNPKWEATLGWTLDELRSRPFIEFVHPDDLEATIREAGRLLRDSTITVDFENRYRHKRGHWVPLSWVAAVKGSTFFATARDMTTHRAREAELASTGTRLRTIIDTAVDAIITIDDRGAIRQVNPAVTRLFGYEPEELKNQNVSLLLPSPDREQDDGYLASDQRTGEKRLIGVGRDVTALRKDGTSFSAELSLGEFHIEGDRFFTGILRDISERKRLERLQSEFVSTVSHELRTPLTSIRGSLGLVANGLAGEITASAKEYIDIALSNSDRLIRLINDILDMEKMQSGRMKFQMKAVDLNAAVNAAMAANEAFATAHGTWIVRLDDGASGEVVADEDRLAQVLTNLLSNAAKFSSRGDTIEVSVSQVCEHMRVTIRDYGPGVPEEFRSRIFQRFAQADGSSSRQKGGTGLGLSICKAIIERMRGRIDFEPAPGRGTCFFFELPRVAPLGELDRPHSDGRPTVLVCETDPDGASMLCGVLASAGLETHVAPTVERARQLMSSHRYAAVTLDLMLADGDGTVLIHDIRANKTLRRVPILVVSAMGRREARDHLGSAVASVADIVEKPFEPTRLLEVVAAAVSARQIVAPRILHVEDDPDLQRIVGRLLPADWTVVLASTLAEAREQVHRTAFDLVLLDLSLPDGGGEGLIDHVGQAQVIIFSASEASPALAQRVSAALVKSRVTELELRTLMTELLTEPVAGVRS